MSKAKKIEPVVIPITGNDGPPKTRIVKSELTLKCILTDAELKAIANEMSLAYVRKQQREADLKTTTAALKAQIASADGEVGKAARMIEAGFDHRLVQCETVLNFNAGTAVTMRMDTFEILESRPLIGAERQLELVEEEQEPPLAKAEALCTGTAPAMPLEDEDTRTPEQIDADEVAEQCAASLAQADEAGEEDNVPNEYGLGCE